jgi:hypothetical protein
MMKKNTHHDVKQKEAKKRHARDALVEMMIQDDSR